MLSQRHPQTNPPHCFHIDGLIDVDTITSEFLIWRLVGLVVPVQFTATHPSAQEPLQWNPVITDKVQVGVSSPYLKLQYVKFR